MAQVIEVTIVDDLDRMTDQQSTTTADETVRFSIDGAHYEIDLSGGHAKELRASLERYREAGRRVRSGVRRPRAARVRSAEVRAWAKKSGKTVSDHGRIPASIVEEYEAAHA